MFGLLLVPVFCGFLLFAGLLTARPTRLGRVLLALTLAGLGLPLPLTLVPLLPSVSLVPLLLTGWLLLASLLWRVLPLLARPRPGSTRAICWALTLVSCTATTVVLTSPSFQAPPTPLPLLVAGPVLLLLVLGAHGLLTRLLARRRAKAALVSPPPLLPRQPRFTPLPSAYRSLACPPAAGVGPAALFGSN